MITVNGHLLCEYCFAPTKAPVCPVCGYDPNDPPVDYIALKIGSVLSDRYLIGGVLGKGGFGITYIAYDMKLDTPIAIKEYYPVSMALRIPGDTTVSVSDQKNKESFKAGAEKFYDEARMVAGFNGNPNIVSVYDFFRENDTVYYVMGYLKGCPLKAYLEDKNLTEGQAVRLLKDVCKALKVVHGTNVLHRDISPDNIMLCVDGAIRLIDFGAARIVLAEQSQSLSIVLKQGFAPLEQYLKKGKQGPWTDIYALGATVYVALTGEKIDDAYSRQEDDTQISENRHGISEPLWRIIKKCLELRIEDRYQNISELINDLDNVGIACEEFTDVKPVLLNANENRTVPDSLIKERYRNPGEDNLTVPITDPVTEPVKDQNKVFVQPPVEEPVEEPVKAPIQGSKPPKFLIPVIIAGSLLLAALVVGVVFAVNFSKQPEEQAEDVVEEPKEDDTGIEDTKDNEKKEETVADSLFESVDDGTKEPAEDVSEDTTEDTVDEPTEEYTVDEIYSGNNDNELYGLDGKESADYSAATYDNEWGYKTTDDRMFYFAYPLSIYSSVKEYDAEFDGHLQREVIFERSDGSSLKYHMSEYEGGQIEHEMDYVYNNFCFSLKEPSDIISPKLTDQGDGLFIITGRSDQDYNNLVYLVTRVTRNRVYEMIVTFPDFENDDDKAWKSYYTEYLYRSCGFSNSSKSVRSFTEYMNENK